ncbi:MAG TPA: 4Fe-4S binding protein [Trueperaceae bacterium]|nr:4Fe-4S binding protein [Trueperaceae bacterium]
MAGLDDLFSMIFRAVEVKPDYVADRCLVVRSGRDACSACFDACPHDAVRITDAVELDAVDCTGCGLCIRACPSEALADPPRLQPGPALRCSKVAGDAPSVRCLAQLSGPDIVRLAGSADAVTLARGVCAGCTVGGADVPAVVARSSADANALLAQHGRQLLVNVQEVARLDAPVAHEHVSRRSLLGSGVRRAMHGVADAVAPLEAWLPGEAASEREVPAPPEAGRRYRVIAAAEPEPTALVPWRLPRVADGCILCPACTRACPTGALRRDLSGPQGALMLTPDLCVGCDACVPACPVNVMSMDGEVTWSELSGGEEEAFRAGPERLGTGALAR